MTDRQLKQDEVAQRKADHINLALQSRIQGAAGDPRFYYEPLLSGHPQPGQAMPCDFLGKKLQYPLWVSSMTGGTELARKINLNLARMCAEFGFGMGLGSCRILLDDRTRRPDFDVRDVIGAELPLFANLGIAQIESLRKSGATGKIMEIVDLLRADGLVIHVNPLQEWLQPEGDRIAIPPVETIGSVLEDLSCRVVVKEVGQGMGPSSIHALLKLPVDAVELAALGGTNFALLELVRGSDEDMAVYEPLAKVGHTAEDMIRYINGAVEDLGQALQCKQVIISGGLRDFLDGYYLMNKLILPSIYGHASEFLKYARSDYQGLKAFAQQQVEGLKLAKAYLRVQ